MKPRHKNLAASALLLAIFAIPAVHLASENRKLADQLDEIKSPLRRSDQTSLSQRTLSTREMTVGRLYQQGPVIKDTRTLFRSWILAQQNQDWFGVSKLEYQLKRMTLKELRSLRMELRALPSFDDWSFDLFQRMISSAEITVGSDRPDLFFDGIIKVAHFDSELSKRLQGWASSDPKAAIAWFQSKNATTDFNTDSIAGRENRALVFQSLVEGIATQDLGLAVELFTNESRRLELKMAGEIVVPLAIKRATEQGNDQLLRKILESSLPQVESSSTGAGLLPGTPTGNPWFDYTKETSDHMKSVELLRSLKNQDDLGGKMASIIMAQDKMSHREKMDWLNSQIPDRENRIRAFETSLNSIISEDPFVGDSLTFDEVIAQPQGENRDLELLAAVQVVGAYSRMKEAERLTAEISAPDLRARAEAILEQQDFVDPTNE